MTPPEVLSPAAEIARDAACFMNPIGCVVHNITWTEVAWLALVILMGVYVFAIVLGACRGISIFHYLLRRQPSPKPETTTPAADATPSNDDDEWADIRAKLAAENNHQKGN